MFNKGSDYWKYGNNYEDDDEYMNNGQFDNDRKKGFFKNKLGDKMSDLRSHENQRDGIIGPNISKEKLMGQFRTKLYIDGFIEKRRQAYNIKINLNEEIRCLDKWI